METVNDADGMLANFWRAVQADPESVARHADWPVNESDLHARHAWLTGESASLQERLEGDPDWFDAKTAGWWVWGASCWIGNRFCSGAGPWRRVRDDDGNWVLRKYPPGPRDAGRGVMRTRPHLSCAGRGVNRQSGSGGLSEYFGWFAGRLRRVRVCCGDWSRVCTPAVTTSHGLTAVFLDPPYADTAGRDADLYRRDSLSVAHDVRRWAVEHGDDPRMRIALCGYEGEHEMPDSWECMA